MPYDTAAPHRRDPPRTEREELAARLRLGTFKARARRLLLRPGVGADEVLAVADRCRELALEAPEGGEVRQEIEHMAETFRALAPVAAAAGLSE